MGTGRWRGDAYAYSCSSMSVLIVLLLILVNGVFAMAEIAVVSANKMRLQQKAEAGQPAAKRALALAENPNTFLSTTQIGITLVGVFSGAFGGATLSGPLAELLRGIPFLASAADPLAFGVVVVLITYVSLVVGELVPKRIGLNEPERIAMALGGLMQGLSQATKPLVSFLSASTNALLALLRVKPSLEEEISEEDIDMMIAQGLRAGVIEPAEQEIIENAFWLGERKTNAIMTPRHEVSWFDLGAGRDEVLDRIREEPHGRYLVCDGQLDNVVGYVALHDLLIAELSGGQFSLTSMVRKPLMVPETLPILSLLGNFRESRTHFAVVLDEYGGVEGIATLADILEELVGDMLPPDEGEQPEVLELAPGRWRVQGSMHVDDFLDLLGLDDDLVPEGSGYQTLGGLLADELGRVPQVDDEAVWHGYRLHVEEMDGLRVGWVVASRAADEEPDWE